MRWTEDKARAAITRNNGMVAGKQLWIRRPGISLLGAIDYLLKKHGYIRFEEPTAEMKPKRKKSQ